MNRLPRGTQIIVAGLATLLMITFILGLAYSISTGFAGFWGGLPFWVISVTVLSMAVYDFWEEAIKRKK